MAPTRAPCTPSRPTLVRGHVVQPPGTVSSRDGSSRSSPCGEGTLAEREDSYPLWPTAPWRSTPVLPHHDDTGVEMTVPDSTSLLQVGVSPSHPYPPPRVSHGVHTETSERRRIPVPRPGVYKDRHRNTHQNLHRLVCRCREGRIRVRAPGRAHGWKQVYPEDHDGNHTGH